MKLLPFQPRRDPEDQGEAVCRCLLQNLDALYSTARRLSGRADVAEDLVQETARKALQAAPGLRHERNLRAWLFKILVNAVRQRFRSDKRWEELEPEYEPGGEHPDIGALSQAAVHDVRRAIEQLSPPRRAVVVLVDIEQFTIAETAVMLETPPGTVASRLARARNELRQALQSYRTGSACEEETR